MKHVLIATVICLCITALGCGNNSNLSFLTLRKIAYTVKGIKAWYWIKSAWGNMILGLLSKQLLSYKSIFGLFLGLYKQHLALLLTGDGEQ